MDTETLIATWHDVIDSPWLHDLPFKIELNEKGKVEFDMSPAKNQHSDWQFQLGVFLERALGGSASGGSASVECSILTSAGVKVADVVWRSQAFFVKHRAMTPYPKAPELCVEIVSPSNSRREMAEKTALYLSAGAQEVWIVWADGTITLHGAEGERSQSCFGIVPPALEVW